jgi:lipoate-protein ligase B
MNLNGRAAWEHAVATSKPKLVWIIFENSVRTAKKTQHFTITKINWLTLFKEIIAVYTENHTKHINKLCGKNAELLNVKAGGKVSYHCVL